MKIISWNCHHGLTDVKLKALESVSADLNVLLECREMDLSKFDEKYQIEWYGDGLESQGNEERNLGIALIARKKRCLISRVDYFDEMKEFRYVLPFKIYDKQNNKYFILCAVWTKQMRNEMQVYKNYHIPVYEALGFRKFKDEPNVVLIGDFNTGSVKGMDSAKWYKELNETVEKDGFSNTSGSKEWDSTFFRDDRGWLDDHCFIKTDGSIKNQILYIGTKDKWICPGLSDHLPLILSID